MRTRHLLLTMILVSACSLGVPDRGAASSVSITLEVTDPNKRFEGGNVPVLQVILGSQLQSGFLTVNAPWTGGTAADKVQVVNTGLITAVLGAPPVSPFKNAKGSIDPKTPTTLTISGLPNKIGTSKTKVTFKPGKSGEGVVDPRTGIGKDIIFTAGDPEGAVGFQNSVFASLDGAGNPSTFTAGILTDAGEFFATVDAEHLANLQGATIVKALFDQLNPGLASRGAEIVGYSVGDDVLNFAFDPGKTLVAGVIFGTTAESDGLFATIEASEVASPGSLWLLTGGVLTIFSLMAARAGARGRPARRRGPGGGSTLRRRDGRPAAR